jgi:predicted phage terminase large subunit-like protein
VGALDDIDLDRLERDLPHLDEHEKVRILELLEERDRLRRVETARQKFIPFVKMVWPGFIPGAHHNIMAEWFEKVASGECKRLVINMPPRFTKSELTSWMLPAWFFGQFPTKKIIQASNTDRLASGFGRRVRNMISGEEAKGDARDPYHEIFPEVYLAKDSQAADLWHTGQGGEYIAIGVGGKITGKGGDIVIIDDPHSEQEAKNAEADPGVFEGVYDWYTSGPRQRLQPGGAIILVMTRWGKGDLTGKVLKKQAEEEKARSPFYDKWKVIDLPAILDEDKPTERSMWPAFWPLEALKATKSSLPVSKWQAQYQQQPTSEQGAILKRDAWRIWGEDGKEPPGSQHYGNWRSDQPPACHYVLQSWDTASTKTERSDYTACTTWGVFEAEDPKTGRVINNLILLDAFKARMEFPELKKRVKDEYKRRAPDSLLVEFKNSGMSLIQELHAMGVPAEPIRFGRGKVGESNDKIARANSVTDILASGYVWRPSRRFAEEVAEECGEFPNGEHDDYVDSVVHALRRFRDGSLIRTANDDVEDDEDEDAVPLRRGRAY